MKNFKYYVLILVAIAFVLSLTACNDHYPQGYAQQQYTQAPQPVIIQQGSSSGFHTGDAAVGALAGAAAMHALSNNRQQVAPVYVQPARTYYRPQPQRSVTTTTVRKTSAGTVTRTTTRRR